MPRASVLFGLSCWFALACGGDSRTDQQTPPPTEAEAAPAVDDTATTDVEELQAFARLFGYIRYFYPSDAAAALDWDGFAVRGASEIVAGGTCEELRTGLGRMFGPVAPDLQLLPASMQPASCNRPADGSSLDLVAWQHLGFGQSTRPGPFASKRTARDAELPFPRGPEVAQFSQTVPVELPVGTRVRVRAKVRVEPRARSDHGGLVLELKGATGRILTHSSLAEAPIVDRSWTDHQLESTATSSVSGIYVAGVGSGDGRVLFDDFVLEHSVAGGGWQPVEIENAGFEDAPYPESWVTKTPWIDYRVIDEAPASGHRALAVRRQTRTLSEDLFASRPALCEVLSRPLGCGLVAHFPIALHSRDGRTVGPPTIAAPSDLTTVSNDPRDLEVRRAAVVVTWNALQHFAPNLDRSAWADALQQGLENAGALGGAPGLHETLARMVATTNDGHGKVSGAIVVDRKKFPAKLARVEGRIAVTWAPPSGPLRRGDVVLALNGVPIETKLAQERWRVAGTPRFVEAELLGRGEIAVGPKGASIEVTVVRDGQTVANSVPLGRPPSSNPFDHDDIEVFVDGTIYVNLNQARWDAIEPRLSVLATAPGLVFDLRRYPKDTTQILAHLLRRPDDSSWQFLPQIMYPDFERVEWEERGWHLGPAAPQLPDNVVFITSPAAVSAAESMMAYVEAHHMGEIIGGPTGGTNGTVVHVRVPGGARVSFTGMRVTQHDGVSPHFGIGTLPTRTGNRTLAGVREGRDELLEQARRQLRH